MWKKNLPKVDKTERRLLRQLNKLLSLTITKVSFPTIISLPAIIYAHSRWQCEKKDSWLSEAFYESWDCFYGSHGQQALINLMVDRKQNFKKSPSSLRDYKNLMLEVLFKFSRKFLLGLTTFCVVLKKIRENSSFRLPKGHLIYQRRLMERCWLSFLVPPGHSITLSQMLHCTRLERMTRLSCNLTSGGKAFSCGKNHFFVLS